MKKEKLPLICTTYYLKIVNNSMMSTAVESKLFPVFIELETSTLCNRRCYYCPNSIYKRGLKQRYISDKLYNQNN